jgi:hypothetical protein
VFSIRYVCDKDVCFHYAFTVLKHLLESCQICSEHELPSFEKSRPNLLPSKANFPLFPRQLPLKRSVFDLHFQLLASWKQEWLLYGHFEGQLSFPLLRLDFFFLSNSCSPPGLLTLVINQCVDKVSKEILIRPFPESKAVGGIKLEAFKT